MKNLQILVLFVLLAVTLSLRLHEQKKVAPSEEEYEEAPKKTAPSKASAEQEEPAPKAANTKKPAAKAEEEEQPEKPAAKAKPAKAEPAAEKAEPAEKAESAPAKSAAADSSSASALKSLNPEELKQFNSWKDSLIPLAPFESGKDNTNALDAQLEKLTLAKIEEIKKKSESK